ncbi:hypothetical protein B9Y76_10725 [Stenotrophomonas maltophilia]|uniref:hypothetical protein n=1 Tax=Stenotrophomonas maltophilia TaxID=40324 RepID=UPI000B4E3C7B|nr:hypothetical protein [Stenotrophomonas maltophilia]MPS45258.1 hypothetical protein [Stenotrophomonas sp.]MBA0382279.1 hypothetical protein [Stenotrophomonas maltophilia]OWQ82372.1 hypothetical protein CEE62_01745 [Stenotrophomonas maltophilia]PJL00320.1 hypothetical protein B9Y76_10725 [Stenotrophomonas maltophilia]QPX92277.1 hypothetical protein HUZ96_05160 [Stenotrophomonas maltophilia]
MVPTTRFTSLTAVEVWDSRFRWRDGGKLHDTTVDLTWRRVAEALASVEGPMAPLWMQRFISVFSRWELLPDERLLALAGTGQPIGTLPGLAAVLNLAAFIRPQPVGAASLDCQRLVATAGLAVRLLDNALLRYGACADQSLRIGFIGMADALHRLGTPFGTERARQFAVAAASLLAEGCFRVNVDLAQERGQLMGRESLDQRPAFPRNGVMPGSVVLEAMRNGVRHSRITALAHHPELARFANDVTDAIEPLAIDVQRGCDALGNDIHVARARLGIAIQPYFDAQINDAVLGLGSATPLQASDRNGCAPR